MSLPKFGFRLTHSHAPSRPLLPSLCLPTYSHDNLPLRQSKNSLLSSGRASPSAAKNSIYNSKILISNKKDLSQQRSVQKRPFSSSGKNDLFRQMAIKVQKERLTPTKINQEITQEYYDISYNKENVQRTSNRILGGGSSTKKGKLILTSKSKSKERYADKDIKVVEQRQRIRFNKVGAVLKRKDENEMVRTSEAEFLEFKHNQSLDMRPVM